MANRSSCAAMAPKSGTPKRRHKKNRPAVMPGDSVLLAGEDGSDQERNAHPRRINRGEDQDDIGHFHLIGHSSGM